MPNHCFLISLHLITDSGYEVECGLVGVLADHAVGVGEMVEEAAGWIVLPGNGRSDAFQIHPNHAAFGIVVKMGAVSYTHLDVYKRQAFLPVACSPDPRPPVQRPDLEDIFPRVYVPVSYTHLAAILKYRVMLELCCEIISLERGTPSGDRSKSMFDLMPERCV